MPPTQRLRPSLGYRRVAGAQTVGDVLSSVGGARKKAQAQARSQARSHEDELESEGECPSYSAVRETKDGRSYVLQKSQTSRGRSVLTRRFCTERKSENRISKPSLPSNVLKQGEYILEQIARPKTAEDREELDRVRHEFRANPVRHVWLGVTSDEIDCWDKRFQGYQFGQQIGRGSFGSVHEACKDENCKYVLKISFFTDDFDRQVAEREIAVMQQLNDTGLIARLITSKMCQDKALMLMERFDMSAEQLGKKQYEKFFGKDAGMLRDALLFTDTQIQQLFELAVKLSDMGISHGDLKLDNLMYRVHDQRFIVIDFGFTGTYKVHNGKLWTGRWGFTHSMGCSQQKEVPQALAKYSNLWQLIVDLGASYPIVLVAIEDPNTKTVTEIRLLVGLGPRFAKILNRQAIREIQKECPEPKGDLWQARKEFSHIRDAILRRIQPYWV